MDLGIIGKRALVTASSKGLGRGCAEALAAEGVSLVLNARGAEALESTAEEIRQAHGVSVKTLAGNVADPEIQHALLEIAGEIDILVTNAGGPPPGYWQDWDREDFIKALDLNMLTPIALMRALMPGMCDRGWGRVVNITSMAVRSPASILGLSNSARNGLTGYVAGTARQVAPFGVNINNILPGYHATDRMVALDALRSKEAGLPVEKVHEERFQGIPARRYGEPAEFGALCAFLCSQHAGYIVGQNILHDGGVVNLTT